MKFQIFKSMFSNGDVLIIDFENGLFCRLSYPSTYVINVLKNKDLDWFQGVSRNRLENLYTVRSKYPEFNPELGLTVDELLLLHGV
jgi:predicted Ser/Thr protein kinase